MKENWLVEFWKKEMKGIKWEIGEMKIRNITGFDEWFKQHDQRLLKKVVEIAEKKIITNPSEATYQIDHDGGYNTAIKDIISKFQSVLGKGNE